MKPIAILCERLYVPREHVRDEHLKAYTLTLEKRTFIDLPRKCVNCKWWGKNFEEKGVKTSCYEQGYFEDSLCGEFEQVARFEVEKIDVLFYLEKKRVYAFARGDLGKLARTFHDFEIDDQRAAPPIGIPLEFKGTLRDYQEDPVRDWIKHGYGILKSPTASGKSVMLSYIIADRGVRTLILSHETRHLDILEERIREFTNVSELEEQDGKTYLGRFKRGKGVYPITLSTFQSLTSKIGKQVLPSIAEEFGMVWVDECHHQPALTFHQVFSAFNAFYRGGTTATPTRKDQMHHGMYHAIGPVVAEGQREMLRCEVSWVRTGIKISSGIHFSAYPWSKMIGILAKSDVLMDLLVKLVLQDLEDGRKPLVIIDRRQMLFTFDRLIQAAGYNTEVIVGGSVRRSFDAISERLRRGTLHCVIGTKVLNENVDIPPLDCLHLPLPSANNEMEEQRAGRIRRPDGPDKPKPIIRAYCFGGVKLAMVGEYTRQRVYQRLGFIDGNLLAGEAPPGKQMSND